MRRSVVTPFFPEMGYSMFDEWFGGYNAQWTLGKTATRDAVLGGPYIEQHWQLISVSVQMYLRWIHDSSVAPYAMFGKLGRILTGLSVDQVMSTQADDQYLTTVAELPTDTSLVTDLWNPVNDPMPPIGYSGGGGVSLQTPYNALAMTAQISPPNPIDLFEGVNPVVGIWMMPSLLGVNPAAPLANGVGLDVAAAKFTINYEDGL